MAQVSQAAFLTWCWETVCLPSECHGRVAPRSGFPAEHFTDTGVCVIEKDYRRDVGVLLFNFGKETFEVQKGDPVTQLTWEQICLSRNRGS